MRSEYSHEDAGHEAGPGRIRRRGLRRQRPLGTEKQPDGRLQDLSDYLLRWLDVLDDLVECKTQELRHLSILRARIETQFAGLARGEAEARKGRRPD
jgi:hypothetical protein